MHRFKKTTRFYNEKITDFLFLHVFSLMWKQLDILAAAVNINLYNAQNTVNSLIVQNYETVGRSSNMC